MTITSKLSTSPYRAPPLRKRGGGRRRPELVEGGRGLLLPIVLLAAVACTSGAKGDTRTPDTTPRAQTSRVTVATLTPVPVVGRQVAAVPVIPTPEPAATPDQSSTLILVPATSTSQPDHTATPAGTATTAASPTVTFTPSPSPTPGPPTLTPTPSATPDPSVLSSVENSLINAHNDARQTQGLSSLTMHPTLMSIARTRAQHMAQVNSMTHYGPSGATVFTLMNQQGYAYSDGAENIHFNSGFSEAQSWQTAMTDYLASPSHRTAIMKGHFRRIGVAVATSASGVRYYSVVLSD